MSNIFCPFTKGDCEPNCVFNNGYYGENDVENCNLAEATKIVQSFDNTDRPASVIQKIVKQLDSIESNTGFDNTSSSDISRTLDDIRNLLIQNRQDN